MRICFFLLAVFLSAGTAVGQYAHRLPAHVPADGVSIRMDERMLESVRKLPLDWRPEDPEGNRKRLGSFIKSRLASRRGTSYLLGPLVKERHIETLLRFCVEDPRPDHRSKSGFCIAAITAVKAKSKEELQLDVLAQVFRERASDAFVERWDVKQGRLFFVEAKKHDLSVILQRQWAKFEERKAKTSNRDRQLGYSSPESNDQRRIRAIDIAPPTGSKHELDTPVVEYVSELGAKVAIFKQVPGYDPKDPVGNKRRLLEHIKSRQRRQVQAYEQRLKWTGGHYRLHEDLGDQHQVLAIRFTLEDPFPWSRRELYLNNEQQRTIAWAGVICKVAQKTDHRVVTIRVRPLNMPVDPTTFYSPENRCFLETWRVSEDRLEFLRSKVEGFRGPSISFRG